jgi:hypothetical protein
LFKKYRLADDNTMMIQWYPISGFVSLTRCID